MIDCTSPIEITLFFHTDVLFTQEHYMVTGLRSLINILSLSQQWFLLCSKAMLYTNNFIHENKSKAWRKKRRAGSQAC